MATNLNIIKCPQCNSKDNSIITDGFFHCNQCGSNYYGNKHSTDGFIVKSGKSSITSSTNSPQLGKQSKKNFLLPIIVFGLLVVYFSMPVIVGMIKKQNSYPAPQTQAVNEDENTQMQHEFHSRTAYLLYNDNASQQSLYKATFLTQNMVQDDSEAVLIKQENDQIVGYDAFDNNIIPNFNRLSDKFFSPEAVIVYSDKNSVIVKNKINNNYQLEMIEPYTGDVIWTLSEKELTGLDLLNGRYETEIDQGIDLFRNNFRVKLPPNYYIVDKKGQIIGFGLID